MNLSNKLKQIFTLGKNYPWKKPERCPRCASPRLWWHGFVRRYFFKFNLPLWIRRCRCPECGHVFVIRPAGFYPRFQYPKTVIFACLIYFALTGKRIKSISRQIQNYWTKGALLQINRFNNSSRLTLENILYIHLKQIIVSTHSFKKNTINSAIYSPYRFFSVTKAFTFT